MLQSAATADNFSISKAEADRLLDFLHPKESKNLVHFVGFLGSFQSDAVTDPLSIKYPWLKSNNWVDHLKH